MKKITLLFCALLTCLAVYANNSITFGKVNYQDTDPNDLGLTLNLTCQDPAHCVNWIGSQFHAPALYTRRIKINDLKLQDWNEHTRDITSYVPSNCLLLNAPQNLNINVDASGKVTSITCPNN